jgi:hypothetical protein
LLPFLLPEGEFMGHLETVTFVAASEVESHKWWAVNVGAFEKNFGQVVSPELARHLVNRLRAGGTVEFPNRYELGEVQREVWKQLERLAYSWSECTLADGTLSALLRKGYTWQIPAQAIRLSVLRGVLERLR